MCLAPPAARLLEMPTPATVPQNICSLTEDLPFQVREEIDLQSFHIGSYGQGIALRRESRTRTPITLRSVSRLVGQRKLNFLREVGQIAELDHPNICKIHESYEQKGNIYIVSERCDGMSLHERITVDSRFKEEFAAEVTAQLASALILAHSRGIAHGDLKPENVLFLSNDGRFSCLKLTNFGLAAYVEQQSFVYSAPEVLQQATVSTSRELSCDSWSLGVILHVLLSGHFPYRTFQTGLAEEERCPLSSINRQSVSEEAKDLVRALLQHQVESRIRPEQVMEHPWIQRLWLKTKGNNEPEVTHVSMLSDSWTSSNYIRLVTLLFATQVWNRVDPLHLTQVRDRFQELDATDDIAYLELWNLMKVLESVLGEQSEVLFAIRAVSHKLAIDCSSLIDCNLLLDTLENAKFASEPVFNVFDGSARHCRITKAEIHLVLASCSGDEPWFSEDSHGMADEVFSNLEQSTDGTAHFAQWLPLMQYSGHAEPSHNSSKDQSNGVIYSKVPDPSTLFKASTLMRRRPAYSFLPGIGECFDLKRIPSLPMLLGAPVNIRGNLSRSIPKEAASVG